MPDECELEDDHREEVNHLAIDYVEDKESLKSAGYDQRTVDNVLIMIPALALLGRLVKAAEMIAANMPHRIAERL